MASSRICTRTHQLSIIAGKVGDAITTEFDATSLAEPCLHKKADRTHIYEHTSDSPLRPGTVVVPHVILSPGSLFRKTVRVSDM